MIIIQISSIMIITMIKAMVIKEKTLEIMIYMNWKIITEIMKKNMNKLEENMILNQLK